jgi:predicted RecB family nuclease
MTMTDIKELGLTIRTERCLRGAGIKTIEQLTERRVAELRKIRNLGRKTLLEIQEKLVAPPRLMFLATPLPWEPRPKPPLTHKRLFLSVPLETVRRIPGGDDAEMRAFILAAVEEKLARDQ